jgi:hypothetical protein
MGQNIKDFKSWQNVNESEGFIDWITGLASTVTSAYSGKPAESDPAKDDKADAKTDAKTKEQPTSTKSEPLKKQTIEARPYSSKLATISDKLGVDKSVANTVDPDSALFINLDLSKPDNVELYGDICQAWIDIRKPMVATGKSPIKGSDFAEAAAQVFAKTGVYVPPQLVLAQATLEGGFARTSNKPIATKNLFNVGNTDDGSTRSFDDSGKALPGGAANATWKGGILAYFNVLADRYLVPGKKTADDLILGEFTNTSGNRYATSREYEQGLLKLIDDINTRVIA